MVRIVYPPLDVPKQVADGVWIVDGGPVRAFGIPLPVRMTVIRLTSDDLLLHSPTRWTPSLQAELGRLGRIRHLVAPTFAHWKFLPEWRAACPGAAVWGAPGLARRRTVRHAGISFDRQVEAGAPPEWAGEVEAVPVPGGFGFCEAALFHRPTRTAVLADLVVNLEPEKLPWAMRLGARLTGSLAPSGSTPLYLRAILALRRADARRAAAQLLDRAPERVIFAHGRWFQTDGTARLTAALTWLVSEQLGR